MSPRDGHVRVLPLHVANKIAAGEVVERPASVVKELVENAIDAGARNVRVSIVQGGRKLVAVQDDGCGMTKDDAVLAFERQATSKIRDVGDIEEIDTLGFRGEAIPSIASVSRFTLVTRRAEADEGARVQVNAGTLAEVAAAGCPPGTLVEVRDLFCNVPARRKFLRAYVTEENHVKAVFTVHALAHPEIGFTLVVDGRELYRLAPASAVSERVFELFGREFADSMLPIESPADAPVRVTGFFEKPNLNTPTRRDQYVFVNGRPATAPSIAYALREACPRRTGDLRPAAIIFLTLPPNQVDVNVHPTKREVRFRDNGAVKDALVAAVGDALRGVGANQTLPPPAPPTPPTSNSKLSNSQPSNFQTPNPQTSTPAPQLQTPNSQPSNSQTFKLPNFQTPPPAPAPLQVEFAVEPDSTASRPWQWFRFLAQSASGYLLIETDAGIVTVNPVAARERIAYERLLDAAAKEGGSASAAQSLLIPETVQLSPVDAARVTAALDVIRAMGFSIEPFGTGTFKVDAVPQTVASMSAATVLSTIARDLAESGGRRSGVRWREELVAKSVARSFAGASLALTEEGATKLVEELCRTRMPYVCPRGKPVMIFTSTRELNRKFAR